VSLNLLSLKVQYKIRTSLNARNVSLVI